MTERVPHRSPRDVHITLICPGMLDMAGLLIGRGWGELPRRAPRPANAETQATTPDLDRYQAG